MKKNERLLIIFLLCAISLTACEKADNVVGTESIRSEAVQSEEERSDSAQEERLAQQRDWYDFYIKELDRMLSVSREQEQNNDLYQETTSSIYLSSQSYSGGLQADYNEKGTNAFQIVIMDDKTEEKQRYECRLLLDGSLWFTYQTESQREKDLPGYVVNEDVLRYGRADYAYDDGRTDLEEEKNRRVQEVEQYIGGKTDGVTQEFWSIGDYIFRIDREGKLFIDVTADKESCIVDFLWEQSRRIDCQLAVSEASLEAVEKYKPAGYSLLWWKNAWDDIAVCDLNHDERMDYVVALYPDDYEEVQRYEGFSPYEKSSQYYAACFWLLLSEENGGYETIALSNNIEYWESALSLVEVTFVDDGILQLEYFIGRSPFTNALLRFQYDEEDKNFYMFSSYYRNGLDDSLLIGDVENYGRTSIYSYYAYLQNYCEGKWQSVQDVSMRNGMMLGYYSDSFQYQCKNLMEEHLINSRLWEKEYELLQTVKRHYPDRGLDVHMVTDPTFYNQKLVSGQVELYGYESYDRIFMPIMVDKQSGEYVTVTALLEKEDFMRIFTDWSDDALLYNSITAEEKARCEDAVERGWDAADTTDSYFGEKEEILFLQIVQEGVRIGVWSESDEWMKFYIIEKEYFWGTEVWEYFKPNDR